jgi:hypothetical protein
MYLTQHDVQILNLTFDCLICMNKSVAFCMAAILTYQQSEA